jgi:hypothetical protein
MSRHFVSDLDSFQRGSPGVEDGVGDGGGFAGGGEVVDAEDVGSGEDGGGLGGEGDVEALGGWGWVAVVEGCDGFGEEAFAGQAGEEGEAEGVEVGEAGEEGVVAVATFAEAEARVEDHGVAGDTGGEGLLGVGGEVALDAFDDDARGQRGLGLPFGGAAAGVHEDGSAAELGAGEAHGWIPEVTADVVDDLGAGLDGEPGGGGVVGIDGEDGGGAGGEDAGEDGQDAGLLFVRGEGCGVGAGGFTAEIEDVGSAVEQAEALLDGEAGIGERGAWWVEGAAVGEAVRGDVEYAHDDGAGTEGEGACAQAPEEARAVGEGHLGILTAGDGKCCVSWRPGMRDVILEGMQKGGEMRDDRDPGRWLARVLLLVSGVFLALGFVHLRADFPNFSPWSDWSKMTDEGWYGGGAVQHYLFGRWYLPGSFNPAVAMPVWPAMLGVWFGVTGVGMGAARCLTMILYTASAGMLYALVRRAGGDVAAALAVLLTVANPFCYAFDRLALLEPVTVFWMMLGLWVAGRTRREDVGKLVLLGVLLCLEVLTKTTGVALAPGVLYMLWAGWGWPRTVFGRGGWLWPMAVVVGTAAGLWLAYDLAVVRPHYLADYRLLFATNNYHVHLSIVPRMGWVTLRDGRWVQPVLYPVALGIVALSAVWLRGLWQKPVFGACVIAVAGHLAYVFYHDNFQARYYLVLAMPMAAVVALGGCAVWWERRERWTRFVLAAGAAGVVVWMGLGTMRYVLHPEYSYLNAVQGIAAVMRADGGSAPVLLSDSGADISLFTGIPAVSEYYTTDGLDAVLGRYHPGWYAAWLGWEDAAVKQVGQRCELQEVARYQIFDDPARRTLVLYKMTPRSRE